MKIVIPLAASLLLCSMPSHAQYAESSDAQDAVAAADGANTAKELAFIAAPIKSARDLQSYRNSGLDSPLDKLSSRNKAQFLRSLTFNEKGLTGFRYDVLEQDLTPTEIYAVLALFGSQHLTSMLDGATARTALDSAVIDSGVGGMSSDAAMAIDLFEYECSPLYHCRTAPGHICKDRCTSG